MENEFEMTEDMFTMLLQIKAEGLMKTISEERGVNFAKAMDLLYNSRVYALLSDEKTKLWHFGSLTLYDMLESELKTGAFTIPEVAT